MSMKMSSNPLCSILLVPVVHPIESRENILISKNYCMVKNDRNMVQIILDTEVLRGCK